MKKKVINYFEQLFHDKGRSPLYNQLTVIFNIFRKYELSTLIWHEDKYINKKIKIGIVKNIERR